MLFYSTAEKVFTGRDVGFHFSKLKRKTVHPNIFRANFKV